MTTTLPEVKESDLAEVFPYEDTDDGKDHMTHIINPDMNQHLWDKVMDHTNAQELVDTARFFGLEVVALCGYKWVPMRNPEKYPSCQQCFDIAGIIMGGLGE